MHGTYELDRRFCRSGAGGRVRGLCGDIREPADREQHDQRYSETLHPPRYCTECNCLGSDGCCDLWPGQGFLRKFAHAGKRLSSADALRNHGRSRRVRYRGMVAFLAMILCAHCLASGAWPRSAKKRA